MSRAPHLETFEDPDEPRCSECELPHAVCACGEYDDVDDIGGAIDPTTL